MPGIGEKTEPVLKRMGIVTIGDLARFPISSLRARLGNYGEYLSRLAHGLDDSPITGPGEAKSMSRETTFAEDVRDRALVESTLRYQAERVGRGLRASGKQARCVAPKLRFSDFTTISRQRRLLQADDTDETIFEARLDLLHKALEHDRRAVRLVGIGVSDFTAEGRQLAMDGSKDRSARLNSAIDRIRDRYGFAAIQTGRTLKLKDLFPEE
jgi:DNA polymerase-4